MRPLGIADSATMVLGLQDEIRRSEESRYDHRLHGVLLVAQGMTCPEAGKLLGGAPRTIGLSVAQAAAGHRASRPRNGRRRIKKTPSADAGRRGGFVGHRRSAFSTARLPLSDVGAAGDQRPDPAAPPDAPQRGILR